jgi:hypothetical protein
MEIGGDENTSQFAAETVVGNDSYAMLAVLRNGA